MTRPDQGVIEKRGGKQPPVPPPKPVAQPSPPKPPSSSGTSQ